LKTPLKSAIEGGVPDGLAVAGGQPSNCDAAGLADVGGIGSVT
jgi:hypothetical protein